MEIKLLCNCGKRMGVSPALAGTNVRCPKCGASIFVPAVPFPAGPVKQKLDDDPPRIQIDPAKIVVAVIALAVIGSIALVYFGPLSVRRQWQVIGPTANDEITDVVSFALQAFLSQHNLFDPRKSHAPAVIGDVSFAPPVLVMSMPETVPFHGESTQGDFQGEYDTRTHDISAEIGYGGSKIGATQTFRITGREKNGVPHAEMDSVPLTIYYPPPDQ
jgi:hypothetical protein